MRHEGCGRIALEGESLAAVGPRRAEPDPSRLARGCLQHREHSAAVSAGQSTHFGATHFVRRSRPADSAGLELSQRFAFPH